jgi:hypothetical protein
VNTGKVNEWIGLSANVAVLIGIVFLVFELRSNTESNRIALTTQFSSNWVAINGDVATNRDLASVVQKAVSGAELDEVESIQLDYFIQQRAAQAAMMRRLYQEGFATRDDVHRAYLSLRRFANYDTFREAILRGQSERNRRMIFEEDGVDRWLDLVDSGETTD